MPEERRAFPAALVVSHEQLAAAVRRLRIIEQDLDRHSEVAVGLLTVAEIMASRMPVVFWTDCLVATDWECPPAARRMSYTIS